MHSGLASQGPARSISAHILLKIQKMTRVNTLIAAVAILGSACSIERTSTILTPSDPTATIVAESLTINPDRTIQGRLVNTGPNCVLGLHGTVSLNYPDAVVHVPWVLTPPRVVLVNEQVGYTACCAPEKTGPYVPTYLFSYSPTGCPL